MQRTQPEAFTIKTPRRLRKSPSPAPTLLAVFAVLIAIGTALLMLPIATWSGQATPFVDALFTATSAACVTGLVVLDTGTYWSPFGQVVILLLIQLGGFGIMAGSTLFLALVVGRRTTLRDRVLVQESLGGLQLGSVTWIVKRIAIFTLAAEGVGAVVLAIAFMAGPEAGPPGDPLGIWWGVFHSISAFNNAGFDLTGGFRSLIPFRDDWIVLMTHGALLVLGGLGFAIVGDALRKRRPSRWALETKLVLLTTAILLVLGTVLIGATEWGNPATLGALPQEQRVLNALFESATLRTAGFTALDTGALFDQTLFVVMALMFIGGASGSTAGGIKVNTFAVLWVAIISSVRGQPSAMAFGRRIQHQVVYRALSVALLGLATVVAVGFTLTILNEARFVDTLFEAVSAAGTVGASTGITDDLDTPSKLLVTLTMYAGRLGPLTLVLALAARARPVAYRPAVEPVRIG
ncbi:MAG: TrkH family potassium uptake protein [Candidatus Limnocylindria bacterium]